jgi:hypothetical protein
METCILFCCFGMTDKNEIELPRFVPSYYARDLINKLQQLKQGAKSVEEYYQELQIGMLCCNLEEREDALSIKITQILLVCFILLVKLKGKCRIATQVRRLIFL